MILKPVRSRTSSHAPFGPKEIEFAFRHVDHHRSHAHISMHTVVRSTFVPIQASGCCRASRHDSLTVMRVMIASTDERNVHMFISASRGTDGEENIATALAVMIYRADDNMMFEGRQRRSLTADD